MASDQQSGQGFEEIFQDMFRVCISGAKDLSLGGDTILLAWQHEVTASVAHTTLGTKSLPFPSFMLGMLKWTESRRATGWKPHGLLEIVHSMQPKMQGWDHQQSSWNNRDAIGGRD